MMDFKTLYKRVESEEPNIEGRSWGGIQWKGTDVCMDVYCECGCHGHVDGDFFYYYRCPGCKRLFAVGQRVHIIPLTEEETEYVEKERDNLVLTSIHDCW